jgi:hypothetical protein
MNHSNFIPPVSKINKNFLLKKCLKRIEEINKWFKGMNLHELYLLDDEELKNTIKETMNNLKDERDLMRQKIKFYKQFYI